MGEKQNMVAYMASVMARVWAQPRFGNPVYLGGHVDILAGAEGLITLKANASKDLKLETISIAQDGVTPDRIDPWQWHTNIKGIEFTSELKTDKYQHILAGPFSAALLFGRNTEEKVLDLIRRQEEVTFTFENTDATSSHTVMLALRCSFYPPILTGLKAVPKDE